jgi:hypothetical protein
MRRWLTAAAIIGATSLRAHASPCDAGCAVVLTGDARKDVTGPFANGAICLAAGDVTDVAVHDLSADGGLIIVRACDGVVRVTGGAGLALTNLAGVRVSGEEPDGGVAFVVDGQRTTTQALTVSGCNGGLEVDHLELHDVSGAGVRADTTSCPGGALHLHDLWVHDVGAEGVAVGGDAGTTVWAQVEVDHTRVERSGAAGLRVGQSGQTWLHDDVVSSAGLVNGSSGLWAAAGSTGLFERNVVLLATTACVQLDTDGPVTVTNSLLVDCAQAGLAITGTGHASTRSLRVLHSTIVRPGTVGVIDSSTGGGTLTVGNTLIVDLGAGRTPVSVGSSTTQVGTLSLPSDAGFATKDVTDPAKAKSGWRLSPLSAARDTGSALTPPVLDDLEQLGRDNQPDIGAHEFAGRPGQDGGIVDAGALDAGGADAGRDGGVDAGSSADGGHSDLPDGGEINPMPPVSGCGCSTLDVPLGLALVLLWRRRR